MNQILIALAIMASPFAASAFDFQGETDTALKIGVQELRGVKGNTKNNLYVKVSVKRGSKRFDVFCRRMGEVSKASFENILTCSKVAETVSNDDNEAMLFDIAWEQSPQKQEVRVQKIERFGDGTMLGEDVEILTGLKFNDHKIRGLEIPLVSVNRRVVTAFTQIASLRNAVENLIGLKATIKDGRISVDVPVKSFRMTVNPDMSVILSAEFDTSEFQRIELPGSKTIEFSMLNYPGELDSGFRPEKVLRGIVKSELQLK